MLFLVAANLVPLAGVSVFGWSVGNIILLYWIETLIIGVLNVPKMWACKGETGAKVFLTPFFIFHYGFFCFGHWSFLSDIMGMKSAAENFSWGDPIIWATISLLVSHLFSMAVNFFGKKEYLNRDVSAQMFFPYGRIVIMHMVIIFSGMFVMMLGEPIAALIFLIALKTIFDIGAHTIEHDDKAHAVFLNDVPNKPG